MLIVHPSSKPGSVVLLRFDVVIAALDDCDLRVVCCTVCFRLCDQDFRVPSTAQTAAEVRDGQRRDS